MHKNKPLSQQRTLIADWGKLRMDSGVEFGVASIVHSGLDSVVEAGVDSRMDSKMDSGVDTGLESWIDSGVDSGIDIFEHYMHELSMHEHKIVHVYV